MSGVAKKLAAIDGLGVHYLEAGAGEPIVYLHGAGGRPPEGASFVEALAARHRVLLPSRPGFDETPLGTCQTPEDVVAVIAGFIRAVANGKAHVVAQSAGGAIGCWLAVLHPDLVSSLVLSAPAAFAPHGTRPPPREELEHILYGDHPTWWAPPSDAERQRIGRNAAGNMGRWRSEDADRLKERLSEIAVPTLLLVADGDRLIPEPAMLPYQERIGNCIRIILHGAAHELPVAATPAWVRLVADFVDRGEMFVVNLGE